MGKGTSIFDEICSKHREVNTEVLEHVVALAVEIACEGRKIGTLFVVGDTVKEGLAGREAALWLRDKTLTIEHGGEPLSRYEVEFMAGTEKPRAMTRPLLFESTVALAQARLFGLESLGEGGWLKILRLEDYAPRRLRPASLQQALFPYHEA